MATITITVDDSDAEDMAEENGTTIEEALKDIAQNIEEEVSRKYGIIIETEVEEF